MKSDAFSAFLIGRLATVRQVLDSKAREYATDADRLHNFKRAAAFQGVPDYQVCWNFAIKHLTSIQDMVTETEPRPLVVWQEKLGDAVNYLILLEALLVERAEGDVREGQAGD